MGRAGSDPSVQALRRSYTLGWAGIKIMEEAWMLPFLRTTCCKTITACI